MITTENDMVISNRIFQEIVTTYLLSILLDPKLYLSSTEIILILKGIVQCANNNSPVSGFTLEGFD